MNKIISGATVAYGETLPSTARMPDGTLFFLTTAYTDPANSPSNPTSAAIPREPGLYSYSFVLDTDGSSFGDQVGQRWVVITTIGDHVSRSGDSMSGDLTLLGNTSTTYPITGTKLNFGVQASDLASIYLYSTAADATSLVFSLGDNGAASPDSFVWRGISSSTTVDLMTLNATSLRYRTYDVWHAGNDGAGSTLDADLLDGQHGSYYLSSTNHTGTVPISRGGTNTTTTIAGGVVYGTSTPSLMTSSAGTAGQLLESSGSGAPTWINQSAIAAGTAAKWSTPRTITLTGAVTGSVSLDGSANVSLTTTSTATSTWSGISDLPFAYKTFSTGLPTGVTSVTARPSLYYVYQQGVASPTPNNIPSGCVSGFDAYSSTDMPSNYLTGFSITGSNGVRGLQIAANWNTEEVAPTSLYFRTNDETGTTTAWAPWTRIATATDIAEYLPLTGGTLTGNLTVNTAIIATTVSSGPSTSVGRAVLTPGYASTETGSLKFYKTGVSSLASPTATIGAATGGTNNSDGTLYYTAATHRMNGYLEVTQNITAYASDGRLKKNVAPIANALDKVRMLGGYEYDWDLDKCGAIGFKPDFEHEIGLIAQDVERIVPQAVAPAPVNNEYLTVRYEKLVSLLMAAMNEQQTQIEELRAEVAALRNK